MTYKRTLGLNFLMFNHLERKKRNKPTPAQARGLEMAFQAQPKPSKEVKVKLSKELGLNLNSVQIWFQNRRAKHKNLINQQRHSQIQASPAVDFFKRRRIQLPKLTDIEVSRTYQSSDPRLYHLSYPSPPQSQISPILP
ncbi:LIM/homeobox protein Lhx1 [Entomophthora muscae]|uniref:LIM/homeobox protein Lhx1 n=1 Tax=Entomophthora muscae TaxID=34485 RepID=A0ACC2RKI0_9FUNG|nr:LIM/homeobox protein Lhx1 [Entomophthora muscae]